MERIDRISPFIVMEILERAKELERRGKDIVHMEIGEPDLPPSPAVLEALERYKNKAYGYTHSLGLTELREAIAEHYFETYGVEISPGRVVVTTGTSGAFSLIFSALFEPGEGIVYTDPGYPCYKNFAAVYCLEGVAADVDRSTRYQLTPDILDELGGFVKPFKGFVITSPSNPIGNIYEPQNLRRLAEYAQSQGLFMISDEIYHGLNYEKPVRTALEFSDGAIVVSGFSKAFCMPGFRIGWLVVPERFVRPVQLVAQNLFISAPTLSQYAALAALKDKKYLERVRKTFKERRDYLYGELKKLFKVEVEPEGAFYIWANVEDYTDDSFKFALELLERAGVAVTPGVDFGENNTRRYVRFAYTASVDRLKEAVVRIKEFLKLL
jgi:aspartate/methionine/tyrosine aminotransferase